MKEPILEMRGITKKFGSVTANKDVDLTLYPGEIHALLGENGAGKSTLMNILNGIYKPNHGKIYYKGKKVSIRSPRHAVDMGIGMVHQHFRPTLTAAENVFLYMPDCKLILNKKEMEEQIGKWSSEFHLNVDPSALIWQLSVGEQQRVEIVKLLCRGTPGLNSAICSASIWNSLSMLPASTPALAKWPARGLLTRVGFLEPNATWIAL